ncbi:MAG: pantetheine-phosphate adenylyltransferase [Phycisphaerales bacterium]|jgi:pantetheine-phosphate adenylyltransferase
MPGPHVAIYPGSFDPITFGHLDVIRRGRTLFDELVVAIGNNPSKPQLFTADERAAMASDLVAEMCEQEPSHAPVKVEVFTGLTVDFAKARGAAALLRGVRNLSDLQYEVQQAVTNRQLAGLETAFMVAGESFAYISSSLIKQIAAMGSDPDVLKSMVPEAVIEAMWAKRDHPLLARLRADHDPANDEG